MKRLMHWIPEDDFKNVEGALKGLNVSLVSSKLTPCETLRTSDKKAVYASPSVFNRICVRQGSWYRDSGYCQLKSNWADFLPLAGNLNTEQSMSYEFVYDQNFGQIHLT